MKKMKNLTITIALLLGMTLGLTGCSGETSTTTTTPVVSLVDITTDQGISMKIPAEMIKQENGSYLNPGTGETVSFGVADDVTPLSDWKEESVLALYQSKYQEVVVKSFENGKKINGKEALQSTVTLKSPKGNALTVVLVIVVDGTKNYIINFVYGSDKTDGPLVKYLQASVDSIMINGNSSEAASVKDDFKEYLDNNLTPNFQAQNNEIIKIYTDAAKTKDSKILAKALSETLPAKNNALLEKMRAYSPKTSQVQELHNILINAIELRQDAEASVFEVLTKNSTESEVDAAFIKLDEADAKFNDFLTKAETMKKDLGLDD